MYTLLFYLPHPFPEVREFGASLLKVDLVTYIYFLRKVLICQDLSQASVSSPVVFIHEGFLIVNRIETCIHNYLTLDEYL